MLLCTLHAYTASPIRRELNLFGVSALKGETLIIAHPLFSRCV